MSMVCDLYAPTETELGQLLSDPDRRDDFLAYGNSSVPSLSLDKAWHGLHFLLTGSDWDGDEPLCFLVSGGDPVADWDLGYGPVRLFRPDQVRRLDQALDGTTPDDLRARFDPNAMMELDIYPGVWDRDPSEDDTLGWLISVYQELFEFVRDASREGRGLVVTLS